MSEIRADSKHSPAGESLSHVELLRTPSMGGSPFIPRIFSLTQMSVLNRPHNDQPPPHSSTQDEQAQDYPRPSPPPTFAAEHGLPIEPRTEHKVHSFAASPRDAEPGSSPKASFMHLHKSEVGRR
ncbi:hypothetical protein FRC09_003847 [Ceratobasidium sp. 395]|nr:hypothetical protein FRC09_003847 [Ceratobasidium sp. 395]